MIDRTYGVALTHGSGEAQPARRDGGFEHVRHWIFDLDNTLYPAECHLFAQIDARMTTFVETALGVDHATARFLQKDFYARYGTTLSGLMIEHQIQPEDFLAHVHDIDLGDVEENPALAAALSALPGKKYIFTNGSVAHAENVIGKLGLGRAIFDDIFDICAAAFTPKPHRATYERFVTRCAIDPNDAAMFEDLAPNLEAAHALGMTTVLICSDADWFADEPAHKRPARLTDRHTHVHHMTDDLTRFIGAIARPPSTERQEIS